MGKLDIIPFKSPDEVAESAATAFLRVQRNYVAISGGRIAEKFFDAITSQAQANNRSLSNVHFFWADERCVPPGDADSNYALFRTRVMEPLSLAESQIHRIRGELEPAAAAMEASAEFARIVQPSLDLVILGMGEDGHIASIFPGDEMRESPAEFYRPVVAPKPPPRRITLALHAIISAREVWVLASGPGKEAALGKSLREEPLTPLGLLIQRRVFTLILTDIPPNAPHIKDFRQGWKFEQS